LPLVGQVHVDPIRRVEAASEPLDPARHDDAVGPAEGDGVVQPSGQTLGERARDAGEGVDELGRRAHDLRVVLVEAAEDEDLAGRERERARIGPWLRELAAQRPGRRGVDRRDERRADDRDEDGREQERLPHPLPRATAR